MAPRFLFVETKYDGEVAQNATLRTAMARDQDRFENKRRFQREEMVIRVNYSTVDDFFSEFATNINEGGIFIETERPHSVGTPVTLQFQLPTKEDPLTVTGRVVWTREAGAAALGGTESCNSKSCDAAACSAGMGIEFETLDVSARSEINRLVRLLRIETAPPQVC